MTKVKLQSHWSAQIPFPGPRIMSKFTRPFSLLQGGVRGRDYTQIRGVDVCVWICECAQKPYVVPDQVHIYPDRRGVDMRLQCVWICECAWETLCRGSGTGTASTAIAVPKLKQVGLSRTKTGAEIANTVTERYDYQWLCTSMPPLIEAQHG